MAISDTIRHYYFFNKNLHLDIPVIVNFQNRKGQAVPYQIRQFLIKQKENPFLNPSIVQLFIRYY